MGMGSGDLIRDALAAIAAAGAMADELRHRGCLIDEARLEIAPDDVAALRRGLAATRLQIEALDQRLAIMAERYSAEGGL